MTYREIVDYVDDIKPNAFSSEWKFRWINTLEGKIAADVFLMPHAELVQLKAKWDEAKDTELLVTYPHSDVYVYYLMAKIDEANGEYNKYNNTMDMYNAVYGDFIRWFADNYEPAQGYRRRCGEYPIGYVVRLVNPAGDMQDEDLLAMGDGIYYFANDFTYYSATLDESVTLQGLVEIEGNEIWCRGVECVVNDEGTDLEYIGGTQAELKNLIQALVEKGVLE